MIDGGSLTALAGARILPARAGRAAATVAARPPGKGLG